MSDKTSPPHPPLSSPPPEEQEAETVPRIPESLVSLGIPLTQSLALPEHSSLITSLCLDGTQTRLAVGSADFSVSFWDLPNLNKQLKPFRTLSPHEKQVITSVSFSSDSERLLVCGGGAKPKVISRDGREEFEFMKGDMYLRDLTYTKGHTFGVTDGRFAAFDSNKCYTAGLDGTVRIWDLTAPLYGVEHQLPCQTIIKFKGTNLQRVGVQKMVLIGDEAVIGMCSDSSIQIYPTHGKATRPDLMGRSPKIAQATAAELLSDRVTLVTREMDDSVKIYDLRKLGDPVAIFSGLRNTFEQTGLALSQDQRTLVTGTSASKDSPAELVAIDLQTRGTPVRVQLGEGSVGAVMWDHHLNQLFVGVGNEVVAFYDPLKSTRGVIGALSREVKKHHIEDEFGEKVVYVPNALSMFRPDQNNKRKRFEKVRTDEKLTQKPIEMLTGPGYNGMVAGPRTTAQFVMRTIHEIKGKRVDPLERLKQQMKDPKEMPQYVDSAYLLTQPKKILDYDFREGGEAQLMSLFDKCKHCGMKICQCTKKPI